jgi:hypothetical protein
MAASDEKDTIAACLLALSGNPGVETVVCKQILEISNLVEAAATEDMAVDLLKLVAQIKTPERLREAQSEAQSGPKTFIPHFLQLFEGYKMRIAAAAAECLVVFARAFPGILDEYTELIQRIEKRSSGELLRQCLELHKVMSAVGPWSPRPT